VAGHYGAGLICGFVIDNVDGNARNQIEAMDIRVAVTDTVMVDDAAAEALARVSLDLARAS
jgi:hypothetical protein